MKSRNQREGVYCGKSHGVHLRYGAKDHGFKPHPLKKHLRVRYMSNVNAMFENIRVIHSEPFFELFQPISS